MGLHLARSFFEFDLASIWKLTGNLSDVSATSLCITARSASVISLGHDCGDILYRFFKATLTTAHASDAIELLIEMRLQCYKVSPHFTQLDQVSSKNRVQGRHKLS